MISRDTIQRGFPIKPLGDVADFLDSRRRPITASERIPGPYPYYGANGQQDSVADYIFDEPLILLAEDGGLFDQPDRGIAYAIEGKTWVNNHAHVLRPRRHARLRYLVRVLESYDVTPWITGSTRAKLTKAGASKIQIPLPPLAEQDRIAGILDAADALRAKRREALAQLDTLLQSTFLDMFGDPVTNPMGWEVVSVGDEIRFLTSGSRGWAKYYAKDGDTFIRIQNLKDGQLDLGDIAFVEAPESAEAKRTTVEPGDVLLSITADLGRTAVVPRGIAKAHINQHLAILRFTSLNPVFVSYQLASKGGQAQFDRLNREGVKAGLNFNDVKSIRLTNPPLNLQQRFAAIADSVEHQKASHRAHLAELDTLFASLQSRAFRGDL